jgi:homoserine dehydrogenase
MKNIKIAILGFGNAGQPFAKLLTAKKAEIDERYRRNIIVTVIVTKRRGSLVNEKGIGLLKACGDIEKNGHFDQNAADFASMTAMEAAEKADYDILIELTPLAIFTGQPAIDHITAALSRKKHVITANKGPIAWAYESLRGLAEKNGVCFFHETTVMDGTPVFNLVTDTLPFCRVTEVEGILNSTTNYILEELANGKSYPDILEEGRRRGFVEADPSMDTEGFDAAAKTAALLNVLMRANITPDDISREGIGHITPERMKEAETRGNVIKLLCRGVIENGKVTGSVSPKEIRKGDLFASITGTSSVVRITTDLMGAVSIVEHDPEIEQTGYGIFSDLIRIIKNPAC